MHILRKVHNSCFIHKMQPVTIHVYCCVVILPCRVPETDKLRIGFVKLQTVTGGIFTADVQHNS